MLAKYLKQVGHTTTTATVDIDLDILKAALDRLNKSNVLVTADNIYILVLLIHYAYKYKIKKKTHVYAKRKKFTLSH